MYTRIGGVVSQDKAYTLGVLLKLVGVYEAEWGNLGLDIPEESISSCMFVLFFCLGEIQGHEAVCTNLATLRSRGPLLDASSPIRG